MKLFIALLTIMYPAISIAIENIISGRCVDNQDIIFIYNRTPADVRENFLNQTSGLKTSTNIQKPKWDVRYLNQPQKYINGQTYNYPNHGIYTGLNVNTGNMNIGFGTNASRHDASGSIVQSECVNGYIAGGVMLNLYDAPEQYIEFGGIYASFAYEFEPNARPSPWTNNSGNLMFQGQFTNPWYINLGNNPGGEIGFAVFIKHKHSQDLLHYAISIYRAHSDFSEKPFLPNDPTLGLDFVSTLIKDETKWVTKSPSSKSAEGSRNHTVSGEEGWDDFYRVNISNQDLRELLAFTGRLQRPQDWEVTAISLIFELADEGKASLGGSFRAFEVYKSDQPL